LGVSSPEVVSYKLPGNERRGVQADMNLLTSSTGSGSGKELTEARERQADIQVAVKENERELAKYKVRLSAAFK
jgi:hypothetical protein